MHHILPLAARRRVHPRSLQLIVLFLLATTLAPSIDAAAPTPPRAARMRTDRILVRFKPDADRAAIQRLQATAGTISPHLAQHPRGIQIVQLRPGITAAQALAAFAASGLVAYAEPDPVLEPLLAPNDPHYVDQWNLNNTGIYGGLPGADIMAEQGWELQREAPGILVAVIDSGVRYTHQDLAANMWVNPGESGTDAAGRDKRSNSLDDDANGYIDDVHGINVLNGTGNPMDDWGHGTHVAGIVGAVGHNALGTAGVAWRVRLMACKFISATVEYSVSDAILCLEYARRHGARIVTASWGGYSFTSQALYDTLAVLRDQGIIVTAAAGNSAGDNDVVPLFPASYDLDNIIAVAATDRVDSRAAFSNYGVTTVDLGAPGAPVFSTWGSSDSAYQYYDGTSMAAPHLAGACALLWTRFPTDTHQQIIQRILTTVDVLPTLLGKTRSGGRLNLAAALAVPATAPAPTPTKGKKPKGSR